MPIMAMDVLGQDGYPILSVFNWLPNQIVADHLVSNVWFFFTEKNNKSFILIAV